MANDTRAALAATPGLIERIAPALVAASLLIVLVAPRGAPFWLALLASPVLALSVLGGRSRFLAQPPPLLQLAAAVFAIYLAVNSFWAIDPLEGLSRAALFVLIAALAAAVWIALPDLDAGTMRRIELALLVGIVLATVFLAIETPFNQPIRKLVISIVPFLRPATKHTQLAGGWVDHIALYTLNRNLGVLNLVLWPALLTLAARRPVPHASLAAVALIAIAMLAMFKSEHETSMIAIVLACLVFLAMRYLPKVARPLVFAGWIAATMLVVPAAALAHKAGLNHASWLPGTARNRIVLWNVTAAKVAEAPVFGIGIGSGKPLDEEAGNSAKTQDGDAYPQRTGRHSHNIFMQTWYELGAVGAVLLLGLGLAALGAMSRLPETDQPYAFASFVSAMVIGSFTWGMWQPWFMATFGFWLVTLLIALNASRSAAAAR